MSFFTSIFKKLKQVSTKGLSKGLKPLSTVGLLLVGLISFNVFSSLLPIQLDITEGRTFTLSKGSRKLITKLEQPVTLRLYYSQSLEGVPLSLQVHARGVKGLLKAYQRYSKGNIKVEIIDPKPDTEQEEWALRYGLKESRLANGGKIFFGLVSLQGDREAVVPYLDPSEGGSLEYSISETIVRSTRTTLPNVMLISFLAVGGNDYGEGLPALKEEPWAFVSEISKNYQLEITAISELIAVPTNIDVMMLLHPKEEAMSASALYAIDQYVLGGGKLMVFLDPLSNQDLAGQPGFESSPSSNLSVLLDAWNVEYAPTSVVGDLELGNDVRTDQGILNYPFWINLKAEQMNQEEALTAQLDDVLLVNSGAFATSKDSEYSFTPLFSTTENSGKTELGFFRLQSPLAQVRSLVTDGRKRVLAAIVGGKFKTAYPDGSPSKPSSKNFVKLPPHIAQAEDDNSILLVGDTDFISDQYAVRRTRFLGNVFVRPLNDNFNFLFNSLELLSGGQDLIAVRSRGKTARPFTRLVNIQINASKRFREKESQLNDRLSEVRERLRTLRESKADQALLNKAEQAEVSSFLKEEQKTRRALREVRKLLREDIASLGAWLLALNLLLVPILVGIFGFWFVYGRIRRSE